MACLFRQGGYVKTRPLVLVIVGALMGLSAWWFTQNFGFTKERVRVGYSGEARVNPLFAARLLLERLGLSVQQQTQLGKIDKLPRRATVILAADRSDMDPVVARNLLGWVEHGGHLVVGVEHPLPRDHLLGFLGVDANWNTKADRLAVGQRPGADTVTFPDGTQFRLDLFPSPRLTDEDENSSWHYESRGGARILEFIWGEGRITVFSTLRPLTNPAIGQYDHAALLWYLVGGEGAQGEVFLIRNLESQSLLAWLRTHAAAAVVATGVFLLLALWRVVLRFGPLTPTSEPDRKSLLEHIRALGRFYSDQKQMPGMLKLLREDCLELFARRVPEARGLEGAEQLREGARLTGLPPRELLHAFSAPAATPHEFSIVVRTLANFRRLLSHRQTREGSR
jgi:hypothetical protein